MTVPKGSDLHQHDTGVSFPDPPGSWKADRRPWWLIVVSVIATLLACGCGSLVFLVLTGIIAEPETLIEQIVRAMAGS